MGKRRLTLANRDALYGLAFISPWLFGLLAFTAIPILAAVYFSFTEYDVFTPPKWVGVKNYVQAFTSDPLFWRSLTNTVSYVLLSVPVQIVLAFVVAVALRGPTPFVAFFRTAFYLPMMVPAVAAAVLWSWLFHPRLGVVNQILSLIGLSAPLWLLSETWSKPAIATLAIWHIGQPMVVFLAGLQNIPTELYEAATIDGATPMEQMRYVTIPMMTPTILFNLVVGMISAFQVFTFAYIITGGGPLNSTLFLGLYVYRQAFQFFKMGYASTLAMALFVVVLILTIFVFRSSRSWVYYESGD